MKNRDKLPENQRSAVYAVLYDSFRRTALDHGYALAVHGSMLSDMDLIAVPWIEDAKPVAELVKALSDCIGETVWKDHHFTDKENKPHGRISYTLSIYGDWFIDLSIIPPNKRAVNVNEPNIRDRSAIEFARIHSLSTRVYNAIAWEHYQKENIWTVGDVYDHGMRLKHFGAKSLKEFRDKVDEVEKKELKNRL